MTAGKKRTLATIVAITTASLTTCTNDKLNVLDCESGIVEICGDRTLEHFDGIGACKVAKRECVRGVWSSCSNDDVWPENETCNGLDDDCDGEIDNDIVGTEEQCGVDNVVFNSRSTCVRGTTKCMNRGEYYAISCEGYVGPTDETCNNLDDDCDGEIDEQSDLAIEPCYTLGLDSDSLRHGICHMGIIECKNGIKSCTHEQRPQTEICDQYDNDCDGMINEGLDINNEYDFVFLLDESGSMNGIITMLANTMIQFTSSYEDPKFKWSLVGVPHSEHDGDITVLCDLSDTQTFVNTVQMQTSSTANPYAEPTWTAITQVADLGNNPLSLSWRPNSQKIIILFTDEDGQSQLHENPPSVESTATAMVIRYNIKFFAFIDIEESIDDFDDIAQASGGQIFDIKAWSQTIIDNMHGIIKMSCEEN